MEGSKACFFCCKFINYDIPNYWHNENEVECKDNGGHTTIVFCKDCEELSDNLNGLCRDLEIIKMKIAYYLNQLSNQIISPNNADPFKDEDEDSQHEQHQKLQLSHLQKTFHQKCLSKVQKLKNKTTPQVHLTNCQVQPLKPPLQIKLDHSTSRNDHPVILESVDHQIKIELPADLNSCPYCDFNVNCDNQLQSHINNQHSENFESYTTVNPTILESITPRQINHTCDFCPLNFVKISNKLSHMEAIHSPIVKSKRRVNKCNICGAMIGSANLAQHKRVHHKNILGLDKDLGKLQCKCEYCPLTFTNVWNKEKHVKGVHLGQGIGNKVVKRCDICGAMVLGKNLSTHIKVRHKDVLGIVDEGGVGRNKVKSFRCDGCGVGYAVMRSLWRHLKGNEKCARKVNWKKGKNVRELDVTKQNDVKDPLQIEMTDKRRETTENLES